MGSAVDELTIYRALGDQSRLRIVALLRGRQSALDVREIAMGVALHPNTVRDHLNVLVQAGLVQMRPMRRGATGRPPALYEAAERNDRWMLPLDFERLPEDERPDRGTGTLTSFRP